MILLRLLLHLTRREDSSKKSLLALCLSLLGKKVCHVHSSSWEPYIDSSTFYCITDVDSTQSRADWQKFSFSRKSRESQKKSRSFSEAINIPIQKGFFRWRERESQMWRRLLGKRFLIYQKGCRYFPKSFFSLSSVQMILDKAKERATSQNVFLIF